MYVEEAVQPGEGRSDEVMVVPMQAVKPLVDAALAISDLVHITGRKKPTAIT